MPSFYRITFDPAGRTEDFYATSGSYYQWADGTRLDVNTAPTWCGRCGAIREGEVVETVADIDRRIADLHDPTSIYYQFVQAADLSHLRAPVTRSAPGTSAPDLSDAIHRARHRRHWRAARVSPPKCLACGTTEIVHLDRQPVPHPSGTGTIAARHMGFWSGRYSRLVFTPEGDRINTSPA